jgi:hypothetical protein
MGRVSAPPPLLVSLEALTDVALQPGEAAGLPIAVHGGDRLVVVEEVPSSATNFCRQPVGSVEDMSHSRRTHAAILGDAADG